MYTNTDNKDHLRTVNKGGAKNKKQVRTDDGQDKGGAETKMKNNCGLVFHGTEETTAHGTRKQSRQGQKPTKGQTNQGIPHIQLRPF